MACCCLLVLFSKIVIYIIQKRLELSTRHCRHQLQRGLSCQLILVTSLYQCDKSIIIKHASFDRSFFPHLSDFIVFEVVSHVLQQVFDAERGSRSNIYLLPYKHFNNNNYISVVLQYLGFMRFCTEILCGIHLYNKYNKTSI